MQFPTRKQAAVVRIGLCDQFCVGIRFHGNAAVRPQARGLFHRSARCLADIVGCVFEVRAHKDANARAVHKRICLRGIVCEYADAAAGALYARALSNIGARVIIARRGNNVAGHAKGGDVEAFRHARLRAAGVLGFNCDVAGCKNACVLPDVRGDALLLARTGSADERFRVSAGAGNQRCTAAGSGSSLRLSVPGGLYVYRTCRVQRNAGDVCADVVGALRPGQQNGYFRKCCTERLVYERNRFGHCIGGNIRFSADINPSRSIHISVVGEVARRICACAAAGNQRDRHAARALWCSGFSIRLGVLIREVRPYGELARHLCASRKVKICIL